MHTLFRGLAALCALACTALLPATTVIPPTFERLVGAADYIVRAEVKSVASEWRENPAQPGQRYIATRVELKVLETVSGTPPNPLVLELVGGRVGDTELIVDGAPQFAVGEENFLFVRGNGRRIVPLVGMMHGAVSVRRDARTGESQVVRHDGRLIYSQQDLAPSSTPTSSAARLPGDRPLSAAQFSALLNQAARTFGNGQLR